MMRKEILLLVALLMVAGCTAVEEEKRPLKIAINVWPGYAHAFIAQEKGMFENKGVGVELLLHENYGESQETYLSGNADGVFGVYTDMISHNANGVDTIVVYAVDFSDGGDVIIGKPAFSSLADLAGKKVGIDGINTFSHLFVLTALAQQGVAEGGVFLEDVVAHDVLTALEEGKIDAGHTWEPTTSEALKKGYVILGKAGDVPGIIIDTLALNGDIVRERSDDIAAFIAALEEARQYLVINREESIEIMETALAIGKDELAEGIDGVHYLDIRENAEFFADTGAAFSLYTLHETVGTFYLDRGVLSEIPNVNTVIDSTFIEELNK